MVSQISHDMCNQLNFFIVYMKNLRSKKVNNERNVFGKDNLRIIWHKEKVTSETYTEKRVWPEY